MWVSWCFLVEVFRFVSGMVASVQQVSPGPTGLFNIYGEYSYFTLNVFG